MNLIKLVLSMMDEKMLMLLIFILAAAVALTVLHVVLVKKKKSLKVWRILCLIPLVVCLVHFAFCHLRGGWGYTLFFYGIPYLTAGVIAVWQFFSGRKHGYRVMTVLVYLSVVASILTVISVAGMVSSIHNFTAMNYTEAFRAVVDTMQEEYVLSEWKEIDYEALEAEILPMVEQAEQEQDAAAYNIALMTYCYRFYDAHVQYNIEDEQVMEEVCDRLAGNDYGFSMITLDNGDTIAVLAEGEGAAFQAGIHDGTVITKWNGVAVEEAKKEVECIYPGMLTFPVAENEAYMQTIFLAGTGEEENTITFLDDNGKEQTAVIPSLGSYRQRLETAIKAFYHSEIPDENFSARMLTEECGYLRISSEIIQPFSPGYSMTGDYTKLASLLDESLEDLRKEGMTKLIIDLRNNIGGSDDIGAAVASLFAEEEYFSHANGIYEDGVYTSVDACVVPANGKFADVEVVVLVNAECCSAGDGMAENFSRLPNVTIMGITTSTGVDQNVGGLCNMPDSQSTIGYPNGPVLDENNEPRIDTRADRVTRIPLDVHIPLTEAAAEIIFGGDGDYELEYAIQYLEELEEETR